ncbi:hypothetical protein AB0J72_50015 [Dactylosporangium sp. NPDC049742]
MHPLFLTDYIRERHADLVRDAEAYRSARRARIRIPIRRRTAAAES